MINDGKERKALAIQTKEEGEGGPLLYLLSGEGEREDASLACLCLLGSGGGNCQLDSL